MYSKKYYLEKIEEFGRHNPTYETIKGCVCYLVYLNPGERGWFLYEGDVWTSGTYPHRVHTSVVKDVVYTDNRVIVTTNNTRLTFVLEQK